MSTKKFMDLSVGDRFKSGDVEYVKIPDERVSCCTVYNAAKADETSTKIQVLPLTEVEVNDQLQ